MIAVGVDCRFAADGTVRVRRIASADAWLPVETGRQWIDNAGRHVLVMLPDGSVRELLLDSATLIWSQVPTPDARPSLV